MWTSLWSALWECLTLLLWSPVGRVYLYYWNIIFIKKYINMKMLIFSFRPFTSDWADEKSSTIVTDQQFVSDWLFSHRVCSWESVHEEYTFLIIWNGRVPPNQEPDCLCICTESLKFSGKSGSLQSISQERVNFGLWFKVILKA